MVKFYLFLSLLLVGIGAHGENPPVPSVNFYHYSSSVGIFITKENYERTVCTGVLLNPTTVLTAAHCLVDLKFAQITNDFEMSRRAKKYWAHDWVIHHYYQGNDLKSGYSIDMGLIFLKRPISNQVLFPKLAYPNLNLPFSRIGFGLRNDSNKRTFIQTAFNALFSHYISVKDEFGMPGDSGGPVYQVINNEVLLVGIHTGRQVDSEGLLKNISYMQLMENDIIEWIKTELSRKSCGRN